MRHALALLLASITASAQEISWSATLTPENGGTQTRISWELSTFTYGVFVGGGDPVHSGASFYSGNTGTGAAFDSLPSPSSFSLTTDIVFTNLNNLQSVTADTLKFQMFDTGEASSIVLIGIISSQTMDVADNNQIQVTGSPTGTFVFDIAFSQFNAGTWQGGPSSITVTGTPVPEPSTYGLMLSGLALVGAAVRRRKNSK